jgi:hypothetical protein
MNDIDRQGHVNLIHGGLDTLKEQLDFLEAQALRSAISAKLLGNQQLRERFANIGNIAAGIRSDLPNLAAMLPARVDEEAIEQMKTDAREARFAPSSKAVKLDVPTFSEWWLEKEGGV